MRSEGHEGRGRPRLELPRRPGNTAREEILDAAAELFTKIGYSGTSTRRIADAVGMRQASLYHHFATKDDILDALLAGTVDEALRLADELLALPGPAAERLHALVAGDCAAFPKGVENGHHLQNRGEEPCVFVVIGAGQQLGGGYSDIDMRFTADGRYERKDGTPFPATRAP